ncbi:MAG: bifunctional adenosylcobinamide kinase/adenosylcobinamide-phosphate guanylyltransferase [Deltaproteobacteria bacterium]|nr:bifunctional adenosylcobinamide kinase/adenosylcobinamide-phosphate guanylyltransferase [Deltaproteobacteria bacterium]MBW2137254.1 bifunctional adenosylcobinamide kinase/adenosylcobinamide-phosphate guanylyltransferase [Deltaproteobacteria bacterium]
MPQGNPKELILVLGGARSGKSSWALKYVEEIYQSYVFLATARVRDEEMAERVKLHKNSRGPKWNLLEEPLEVPGTIRAKCGSYDCVLVDCLTIWLSNVMLEKGDEKVMTYGKALLEALASRPQAIILVSNEVGMGIVPEHALGRRFRDYAGFMNQEVAKLADKVVFMVAGLPMFLKGGPDSPSLTNP